MDISELGRSLVKLARGIPKTMSEDAIEQRRNAGRASWTKEARAKRAKTLIAKKHNSDRNKVSNN